MAIGLNTAPYISLIILDYLIQSNLGAANSNEVDCRQLLIILNKIWFAADDVTYEDKLIADWIRDSTGLCTEELRGTKWRSLY